MLWVPHWRHTTCCGQHVSCHVFVGQHVYSVVYSLLLFLLCILKFLWRVFLFLLTNNTLVDYWLLEIWPLTLTAGVVVISITMSVVYWYSMLTQICCCVIVIKCWHVPVVVDCYLPLLEMYCVWCKTSCCLAVLVTIGRPSTRQASCKEDYVFCHMFPKGGFMAVEDECEHHFDWLMRLMGLWHGR